MYFLNLFQNRLLQHDLDWNRFPGTAWQDKAATKVSEWRLKTENHAREIKLHSQVRANIMM